MKKTRFSEKQIVNLFGCGLPTLPYCDRQASITKPSSRGLLFSLACYHRQLTPGQHFDFILIFDHSY